MNNKTKHTIKYCDEIGKEIHNKASNSIEEMIRKNDNQYSDEVFDNFIESCLYYIEEIRRLKNNIN